MIKINKTDISITRGDSAYISFSLTDNQGQPIILTNQDSVRCQVRTKVDGDLIFEGEIIRDDEQHTVVWYIRPQDTQDLKVGSYKWDAQVEFANGDVYTFVDISKFNILGEITLPEE